MNLQVTTVNNTPLLSLALLARNLNISTATAHDTALEFKEELEAKGKLQTHQGETYLNEHQCVLFAMLSGNSDSTVIIKSAFSDLIMESREPHTLPGTYKEALLALVQEVEKAEQQQIVIEEKQKVVDTLRAEVPYIDMTELLNQAGLDISPQKANKALKSIGVLSKDRGRATSNYRDLFVYTTFTAPNGYTGEQNMIVVGTEEEVAALIKKGLDYV